MGRIWKSGRIKKILVSLFCIWLEGWKSGEIEIFFVWLRKKKRIENRVGIYLLICPFKKMMPNKKKKKKTIAQVY